MKRLIAILLLILFSLAFCASQARGQETSAELLPARTWFNLNRLDLQPPVPAVVELAAGRLTEYFWNSPVFQFQGSDVWLVVLPNTELHRWLKTRRGQTARLYLTSTPERFEDSGRIFTGQLWSTSNHDDGSTNYSLGGFGIRDDNTVVMQPIQLVTKKTSIKDWLESFAGKQITIVVAIR